MLPNINNGIPLTANAGDTITFNSSAGTCTNLLYYLRSGLYAVYFSPGPNDNTALTNGSITISIDSSTPTGTYTVGVFNLSGSAVGSFYDISITAAPVTVSTDVSPVAGGTAVATNNNDGSWVLVATPAAGYAFSSWSCDAAQTPNSTSSASTTISPSANTTCSATFLPVLYIVPDAQSVAYGGSAPSYSYTLHTGSTSEPTVTPTLVTAPTCSSDYVALDQSTGQVANSPRTITCTAGSDPSYAFDNSSQANLSISAFTPNITTSGMSATVSIGSSLTLAIGGTVPNQGCTGTVSYSLLQDPTGSATVPYPLGTFTLPTSGGLYTATTGWLEGAYNVSAAYSGDANCSSSADSSGVVTVVPVVANPGSAWGEGYQNLLGTRATFGFVVKTTSKPRSAPATIKGQLTWVQKGSWKFRGTLNAYSVNSATGVGTASGTGDLYYWRGSSREGRWVAATSSSASASITFTSSASVTRQRENPGSFGISFSGTSVAVPLPSIARSPVAGGSIKMK